MSSQFGNSGSAGGAGVPTSVASGARQDGGGAGQNSFSDNKFSGTADSTSSPVPSTVGSNSVGQQPAPFNLGKTDIVSRLEHGQHCPPFQLPHSLLQLPSTPLCHQDMPISTEECQDCSTEEVWQGAGSTPGLTLASLSPPPRDPPAPRSSRTKLPMDQGKWR